MSSFTFLSLSQSILASPKNWNYFATMLWTDSKNVHFLFPEMNQRFTTQFFKLIATQLKFFNRSLFSFLSYFSTSSLSLFILFSRSFSVFKPFIFSLIEKSDSRFSLKSDHKIEVYCCWNRFTDCCCWPTLQNHNGSFWSEETQLKCIRNQTTNPLLLIVSFRFFRTELGSKKSERKRMRERRLKNLEREREREEKKEKNIENEAERKDHESRERIKEEKRTTPWFLKLTYFSISLFSSSHHWFHNTVKLLFSLFLPSLRVSFILHTIHAHLVDVERALFSSFLLPCHLHFLPFSFPFHFFSSSCILSVSSLLPISLSLSPSLGLTN